MSVTVKRTVAPPSSIRAGADDGVNFNGNVVKFSHTTSDGRRPALRVETELFHGVRSPSRGPLAHLYPEDARQLAEALVEWADAVDPAF